MKMFFQTVSIGFPLIALAACSGGESAISQPAGALARADNATSLEATARFRFAENTKSKSLPKVHLAGEYANFSGKCLRPTAKVTEHDYPLKFEEFSSNVETIPLGVANGGNSACPLHLVSIQAGVVDSTGVEIARAATAYDLSKPGKETFSCFSAVGGPGSCLIDGPLSARAREANSSRLIGTVEIEWTYQK